jgi:hypothetical protein
MLALVTARPASHARAASTPAAARECQEQNSATSADRARSARSSTSDTVAPGGFSSMTCLPASMAARAIA